MNTRFILTAATLAALMVPGRGAQANERFTPLRRHAPTSDESTGVRGTTAMLELAGLTIGIAMINRTPSRLDLTLQVEPTSALPHGILIWAGRKNGWGSEICAAKPLNVIPGSYAAEVAIHNTLPGYQQLWIAVYDASGHIARGSVPLPG